MPKPIKEIKGIHSFIHVANDSLDDDSQGMYWTDNILWAKMTQVCTRTISKVNDLTLEFGMLGDGATTAERSGKSMSNKNGTQGNKHEIRKRTIDPLAWLWQIPSLYGFCAVAANVNSALGVKLGSRLTGPVNIKLKPLYLKTIKPVMSLKVKTLYCPPAAVTAWGLGTLLGLIPGTG